VCLSRIIIDRNQPVRVNQMCTSVHMSHLWREKKRN